MRKKASFKSPEEVLAVVAKLAPQRSPVEAAVERDPQAFIDKLNAGVSVKEMAAALAVSTRTLQIYFAKHGVKKTKGGAA